jgi:MFS family permease
VASTTVCARAGVVRTVAGSRLLEAVGFTVVATTLMPGDRGRVTQVALLAAGQFLVGLGMGVEGPVEMSYQQGVTPDRLQGRTNTTKRSVNRAAVVVGAPLGGVLVDSAGYPAALVTGVTGLAVGAVALLVSPLRHARMDDDPQTHPLDPVGRGRGA